MGPNGTPLGPPLPMALVMDVARIKQSLRPAGTLIVIMMDLVDYSPAESRPEGGPSSAFPDPLIFLNKTKC